MFLTDLIVDSLLGMIRVGCSLAFIRSGQFERTVDSRKQDPGYRIIRYGRVVADEPERIPPFFIETIHERTLTQHLKLLHENCNVIPLEQLVFHLLHNEPLPKRSVVVIFDEGWRDFHTRAFPTIRSLGIPTTIAVATRYLDTDNIFWDYKVAIGITELLRMRLDLRSTELFTDETLSMVERLLSAETPLQDIGVAVADGARALSIADRIRLIEELGIRLSRRGPIKLPRSFLSWKELADLTSSKVSIIPLGDIERELSPLPLADIEGELSKAYELLTNHSIAPLPYPLLRGEEPRAEVLEFLASQGFRGVLLDSPRKNGSPASSFLLRSERRVGENRDLLFKRSALPGTKSGVTGTSPLLSLSRIPGALHPKESAISMLCRIWNIPLLGGARL